VDPNLFDWTTKHFGHFPPRTRDPNKKVALELTSFTSKNEEQLVELYIKPSRLAMKEPVGGTELFEELEKHKDALLLRRTSRNFGRRIDLDALFQFLPNSIFVLFKFFKKLCPTHRFLQVKVTWFDV